MRPRGTRPSGCSPIRTTRKIVLGRVDLEGEGRQNTQDPLKLAIVILVIIVIMFQQLEKKNDKIIQ